MEASPFKKILLAMILTALVATLLLQLVNLRVQPPANPVPVKNLPAEFKYHYSPPKISDAKPLTATNTIDTEIEPTPKISRAQAEAWLAKHKRNAMSLLTAFRALGDTNYLNEAATNFPNDPHVELAVLTHDEFPADRRKWLDLLKQSSPSNSLANYLSAEDYFKNGKTNEAVQELLAASGKPQFDMGETESRLDAQDLYLSSGKTALESAEDAALDFSGTMLRELADNKRLAQSVGELQQQYLTSGDVNSAANLAQVGMVLANQLQSGDSGKYLINQLVGIAEERIALSKLDQNTPYDFLNGQTPAQITDQLKQQKKDLVQIVKAFDTSYPNMTDAEKISYRQREIIYGETEAMKWLIEQHSPAVPQQ
jgi:hypothetical protein